MFYTEPDPDSCGGSVLAGNFFRLIMTEEREGETNVQRKIKQIFCSHNRVICQTGITCGTIFCPELQILRNCLKTSSRRQVARVKTADSSYLLSTPATLHTSGPNIATLSPVTQVQYNTAAGTELAPFIPHNAILSRLRARATERNACHDLAW